MESHWNEIAQPWISHESIKWVKNMDPLKEFELFVQKNIDGLSEDRDLQGLSKIWVREVIPYNYTHNFRWLGRPIIQAPQDTMALQELIWIIKPDLIIETGIAHGGSLIFSASMLALLDMNEAIESGQDTLDLQRSKRKVIGIDIDIRTHNRDAIEAHAMASRIQMIQGSSIAPEIVEQVKEAAQGYQRILVCLDSNHTHAHVLGELNAYAPMVNVGGYCIVFDTGVEDLPAHYYSDRPWGKGDNPKTAVWE